MNTDRFRFRVWDIAGKRYIPNWMGTFTDLPVTIDGIILEQCTGIKDRSGRLIYENDLVKDVSEEVEEDMLVVFDEDDAMFAVLSSTTEYSFAHFYSGEDLEIVGNVHEN